jgi:hypothetical protein
MYPSVRVYDSGSAGELWQVERDCAFLQKVGVMDYSLLLGVHFHDADVAALATGKSEAVANHDDGTQADDEPDEEEEKEEDDDHASKPSAQTTSRPVRFATSLSTFDRSGPPVRVLHHETGANPILCSPDRAYESVPPFRSPEILLAEQKRGHPGPESATCVGVALSNRSWNCEMTRACCSR